jgi:Lipid A 3-O-deacylase (PagL)/Outer membrane protein beta-barrel domain
MSIRSVLCILLLCLINPHTLAGQDSRTQYPKFIGGKAYVEVTAGYVSFPFTDKHLLPGFTTEKIDKPTIGVRLALLGYQFNKNLSAQISYMRPVFWIHYKNVNNDNVQHTVTNTVASLVFRNRSLVSKKIWVYGEAGLALLTRSGFYVGAPHVLRDASYGTITFGTGIQYILNKKWSLITSMTYVPKKDKEVQPYTLSVTGGFHYQIQPLPEKKLATAQQITYLFPKHLIQVGYTTDALGFGVNNTMANNVVPLFWGGDVEVKRGVSVHYQHNFFHTRKVFSIDWGASAGYWKSRVKGEDFYTLSLYPLFRFTVIRRRSVDYYFEYSVAGPSFISRTSMDDIKTGRKFTFQDFIGIGMYGGKKRNLNGEIRIMHFSNGGLYPVNNGVKVPLSFMIGYAFE